MSNPQYFQVLSILFLCLSMIILVIARDVKEVVQGPQICSYLKRELWQGRRGSTLEFSDIPVTSD